MSSDDDARSEGAPVRYGRKVEVPEVELQRYSPAPRKKPRRRRGRALFVISIAVALTVILIVIAYPYLLPDEGNTPEEAFLEVFDAISNDDADKLIECSVACLADETVKEAAITELECQLWTISTATTVLNSYTLMTGDESAYLRQLLNEVVDHNEKTYSVEVQDSCLVVANCTTIAEGSAFTEEHPFPFVKVKSYWYLALIPLPEGQFTVESQVP